MNHQGLGCHGLRNAAIVKKVGTVLRQARINAGLSQDALARRIGLTASQISQIELKSSNPGFTTVAKIAAVVGMSADEVAAACGVPGYERGAKAGSTVLRDAASLSASIGRSRKLLAKLDDELLRSESALGDFIDGDQRPRRK